MQTYIGVDVSKNDFLACDSELDKPIKFNNNLVGINSFLNYLKKNNYSKKDTLIGLESTGSYHLPLTVNCDKSGYRVKIINPIITKAQSSSSIRRVKTDKADAKLIRLCLIKGAGEEFKDSAEEIVFKSLIRERYFLAKLKAKLIVKQQDITLKEECLKMPISNINSELEEVVLKKMIYLEQQLSGFKSTQQQLLKSIPGIGKITAMTLVVEIGSMAKFSSAKKLVGFIGLDSKTKESGTSLKVRGHISKRGNKFIRKTLYNAAMTAIQRPNIFYDFYHKKLSEGKAKNVCLCAVMRKMVHVIYAVLKRQSPFVEKGA
jgi:transposase